MTLLNQKNLSHAMYKGNKEQDFRAWSLIMK